MSCRGRGGTITISDLRETNSYYSSRTEIVSTMHFYAYLTILYRLVKTQANSRFVRFSLVSTPKSNVNLYCFLLISQLKLNLFLPASNRVCLNSRVDANCTRTELVAATAMLSSCSLQHATVQCKSFPGLSEGVAVKKGMSTPG